MQTCKRGNHHSSWKRGRETAVALNSKLNEYPKRPPLLGGRFLYDRVVVGADEVRPRVGIRVISLMFFVSFPPFPLPVLLVFSLIFPLPVVAVPRISAGTGVYLRKFFNAVCCHERVRHEIGDLAIKQLRDLVQLVMIVFCFILRAFGTKNVGWA